MQGQSVPCAIAIEDVISLQGSDKYRMTGYRSNNETI